MSPLILEIFTVEGDHLSLQLKDRSTTYYCPGSGSHEYINEKQAAILIENINSLVNENTNRLVAASSDDTYRTFKLRHQIEQFVGKIHTEV